jgi:hypothetical protein
MSKHKHKKHQQTVEFAPKGEKPTPPLEAPRKNFSTETTELRVLIREDSKGNLTVNWLSVIKDTEVVVPMRQSHVLGQLRAASFILERGFYETEAKSSGSASG